MSRKKVFAGYEMTKLRIDRHHFHPSLDMFFKYISNFVTVDFCVCECESQSYMQ